MFVWSFWAERVSLYNVIEIKILCSKCPIAHWQFGHKYDSIFNQQLHLLSQQFSPQNICRTPNENNEKGGTRKIPSSLGLIEKLQFYSI